MHRVSKFERRTETYNVRVWFTIHDSGSTTHKIVFTYYAILFLHTGDGEPPPGFVAITWHLGVRGARIGGKDSYKPPGAQNLPGPRENTRNSNLCFRTSHFTETH